MEMCLAVRVKKELLVRRSHSNAEWSLREQCRAERNVKNY